MKTVLIIDDEDSIRNLFCEALKTIDVLVIEADNGKDGLEKALTEKPDVILLDLLMSDMDGHEVLNKLREDDWGKNAKVIITSNQDDADSIGKSYYEDGVTEYIIKSNVDISELRKKVETAVKSTLESV